MKRSTLSSPKLLFSAVSQTRRATPTCIGNALRTGVFGIDSACYSNREKYVAQAIQDFKSTRPSLDRNCFYIQSKFIPPAAHTSLRTIPYDIGLRLDQQVNNAFFDTYNKFQLGPLDSYLFLTPPKFPHHTLLLVWNTLIKIQEAGRVEKIGLVTERTFQSETALDMLERESGKRVQILQQTYPSSELVNYCRRNSIQLQRGRVEQFPWAEHQPAREVLRGWAESHKFTKTQAILLLSLTTGAVPVVSTTNSEDIKQISRVARLVLTKKQKRELKGIASMLGLEV